MKYSQSDALLSDIPTFLQITPTLLGKVHFLFALTVVALRGWHHDKSKLGRVIV